jgi:hypothetical protein
MGKLVIVRSQRGGEGKTLVAHLLVEYLHEQQADWRLYSTVPRESAYRGTGAEHCLVLDVSSTHAQVDFVDDVLRARDAWTVLDLSSSDDHRFLAFADATDIVAGLIDEGVETLALRVHANSLRLIESTFWPDSLLDSQDVLVLNNLAAPQLADWRASPFRDELRQRGVLEMMLPRIEESAVRRFLSVRTLLHDFLADRGGGGADVFARVDLAKLVEAFRNQFSRLLLSKDLGRLDGRLFR